MRYEFIEQLKKDHRVTELDHAFRINGVVDIYKGFMTVYDIKTNKYHKNFSSNDELEQFATELINKNGVRDDYKQQKNGCSYKEFKNKLKSERYSENTVTAEDYHWNQNTELTSEEHLYFAVVDDKVKIGRSINVEKRLTQLLTGMFKKPVVYVFLNKGFMETKFHQIFEEIRLNGEWFLFAFRIKVFLKKYHNNKTGYVLTPKDNQNAKERPKRQRRTSSI